MNQIELREKIENAIKDFGGGKIFDASVNLFNALGYDTSLQSPLDRKNFDEFNELFIESSPNKERFSKERAFADEWKSIDIVFQLTDESFSGQQKFNSSVEPTNPQSYLCFALELEKEEYTKSALAAITREINKIFTIPIIIVFRYGKKLTLSVINRRLNKKDSERDVLEKVTLIKDINIQNPHRAHIDILCDMSLSNLNEKFTVNDFKSLHKAWEEILDTRTLTKKFYDELFDWYEWACKNVTFPKGDTRKNSSGEYNVVQTKENNELNLIRLITRIMFVWFIKQKDLVPSWIFDTRELKNVLADFNEESAKSGNYYNAILQNLFFATLNQEIDKRKFADDKSRKQNNQFGMKAFYRDNREKSFFKISHDELIDKFKTVPFLNGGLFECLDKDDDDDHKNPQKNIEEFVDGFTRVQEWMAFVPNNLFYHKADGEHEGLINILNHYNFTVEENTPNDVQVALDPELLGKVFENLLGTYNPETSETARKDSGSFYTPREIVNFMVNESLISYLESRYAELADSRCSASSEQTFSFDQAIANGVSKYQRLPSLSPLS